MLPKFNSNINSLIRAEKEINEKAKKQGYLFPEDITNALGYTHSFSFDQPIELTFDIDGLTEEGYRKIFNPCTRLEIQKVIFNPPATVVIWTDGSKTVVKVKEGETYDKWAGLAFCISKKILGEHFHAFYRAFCD